MPKNAMWAADLYALSIDAPQDIVHSIHNKTQTAKLGAVDSNICTFFSTTDIQDETQHNGGDLIHIECCLSAKCINHDGNIKDISRTTTTPTASANEN